MGRIVDERDVRKRFDGQPVIRAALVKTRGGEVPRHQAVAHEKDDAERLLHHPVSDVEKSKSRENKEAAEREQLISELHEAGARGFNGSSHALAMTELRTHSQKCEAG